MKTRPRTGVWGVAMICGCASAAPMQVAPLAPIPLAPLPTSAAGGVDVAGLVQAARPATVLLLAWKPSGAVVYGSGLIIDDQGHVLTSLHVVEKADRLGAMLFRADRTSYTPMDGGLSRYIFENQREILGVTVVDADHGADVALVKIDADTGHLPRLPMASEPGRVGDRVWVIGHPQEAVWSFTSGLISGLPADTVQHDAVVSHGSSGGPLLNDRGEVVGINVAKVVSEAAGFAFARPIGLAMRLIAPALAQHPLDLSTPERAAMACWRAVELASPQLADCFDWDAHWELYVGAAAELQRRLGTPVLDGDLEELKRQWIGAARAKIIERLRGAKKRHQEEQAEALPSPDRALGFERSRVFSELRARDERLAQSWKESNGLKEDLKDDSVLLKVIRMGFRIEGVEQLGGDRAWVLYAGRNTDGSVFRFSELYNRVGARWLQRSPPSRADRETLPSSWPPPLEDHDLAEQKMMLGLLEKIVKNPCGRPS